MKFRRFIFKIFFYVFNISFSHLVFGLPHFWKFIYCSSKSCASSSSVNLFSSFCFYYSHLASGILLFTICINIKMKLTKLFTTLKHINNSSERISLLLLDFETHQTIPPFVNHSLSPAFTRARAHTHTSSRFGLEKWIAHFGFHLKRLRVWVFCAEFLSFPLR